MTSLSAADLAGYNEQAFDSMYGLLEHQAKAGDTDAQDLVDFIDAVIDRFGVFDFAGVQAMNACTYTHAHTRSWCGYIGCRAA